LFKALYPSVIHENNIAPNTQLGKIEIDEPIYSKENPYKYELYNRGGDFIEHMVTDNFILFAHRWFNLANFKQFLEDMDEYYNHKGFGNYSELEKNYMSPIIPASTGVRSAVVFTNERTYKPIVFYNERNKEITYNSEG